MAKLPTYADLGGLPSGRSNRIIASYDTSAIGRGMQSYGESLQSAGNAIGNAFASIGAGIEGASEPSQAQKFETNRRFLEFAAGQERLLNDAKNTVEPGAVGFSEQLQQMYFKNAKEFLGTVPANLKPQYDSKLFVIEDQLFNKASAFETAERKRFYTDEVNSGLDTISNNLYSDPENFDRNFAEGVDFIDTIPDESLSKIEKDQLKKQWRTKAQLAALNGVTPEERIRLLGGAGQETGNEPTPQRAQGMTRGIKGDIRGTISDAAARYGVDPNALLVVAQLESGGNPNAKNPNSSAGGLFQFIDSTARAYGLTNKFDPAAAADAGARLMRDNAIALRNALGREPTTGELYLAHQQGSGGAIKLLSNPGARAVDVVGAEAVRLNGGNTSMTAGEFAGLWLKKAGDTVVPGGAMGYFDPSQADPRFADMSYSDANKIIVDARKQISAVETANSATARDEYALAIATDPMGVSQESILTDERLDNGDAAELINKLKAATKEQLDRQGAVVWADGETPANPFDSDDKKRADLAYDEMVKQAGPEYRRQAGEYVAIKKGVVPKSYVDEIRNGLNGGNPSDVANAAQLAYRLTQNAPGAVRAAENSGDLVKAATAFDFYTNDMGMPPEEVGKKLISMNDPEKQKEREAILQSDVVKKQIKGINSAFVADQMSIGTNRVFDVTLGINDAAGAVMADEYRKMYEEAVVETNGDLKLATKLTTDRFNRSYGTSTLSQAGEDVVTYLPTTRTYQALPDGSQDYLVTQAIESLAAEGIQADQIFFEHAYDANGNNLTERLFKAGDPAPYQIWYEKDGKRQSFNHPFIADYNTALAEYQMQIDEGVQQSETRMLENRENLLIGREKSLGAFIEGPAGQRREMTRQMEERSQIEQNSTVSRRDRRNEMLDAAIARDEQRAADEAAKGAARQKRIVEEEQIRQDLLKKRGMEPLN